MTFNSSGQPIGRPEQLNSAGDRTEPGPLKRPDRGPRAPQASGAPLVTWTLQMIGPNRGPSIDRTLPRAPQATERGAQGPSGVQSPLGDLNSAYDRTEPGPLKRPDRGPRAPLGVWSPLGNLNSSDDRTEPGPTAP